MKKKIVAIIPIKKYSKRVKGKNFLKFGNKKLYQIFLYKLTKTSFDEIYVDLDSIEIKIIVKKVLNLFNENLIYQKIKLMGMIY